MSLNATYITDGEPAPEPFAQPYSPSWPAGARRCALAGVRWHSLSVQTRNPEQLRAIAAAFLAAADSADALNATLNQPVPA